MILPRIGAQVFLLTGGTTLSISARVASGNTGGHVTSLLHKVSLNVFRHVAFIDQFVVFVRFKTVRQMKMGRVRPHLRPGFCAQDDVVPLQGGALFRMETRPSVWVLDDEQLPRARELAADFGHRAPSSEGPPATWTCRCGETSEEQFTECWSCRRLRVAGEVRKAPPPG